MSNTAMEPLPLEVGQLANFEARMVRSFRAAVEDWDEVCSALGAWEARHLAGNSPAGTAAQHRAWVTHLLSWGQLVQRSTQHPDFPDKVLAARIDTRVRHLQDKLALWHREMTPDEEARILQAAFQ